MTFLGVWMLSSCAYSPDPRITASESLLNVEPNVRANTVGSDMRGIVYRSVYGSGSMSSTDVSKYSLHGVLDARSLYTVETFEDASKSFFSEARKYVDLTGDADNVILYSQGGPDASLKSVDSVLANLLVELGKRDNKADKKAWSVFRIHQHNTLYSSLMNENISEDVASFSFDLSSEMLFKVAKYMHDKGKRVYVIADSYGGSVAIKMMLDYKYENYVEHVFVLSARLRTEKSVLSERLKGKYTYYYSSRDGGDYVEVFYGTYDDKTLKDLPIPDGFSPTDSTGIISRHKRKSFMLAIASQYDYVDLYRKGGVSLKNVTFVTSKYDSMFGYYSDYERYFAQTSSNLHISNSENTAFSNKDSSVYLEKLKAK